MTNCTVTGNSDRYYGGVANFGTARIEHSIVYANNSTFPRFVGGDLAVSHSDVQRVVGVPGGTNIDADPQFVDAVAGDFRLQTGSPANGMGAFPWPVSVVEQQRLPEFSLLQNAPNPFNPSTTLRFTLPKASPVRLVLYDVTGRVVRTLVDGTYQPGAHSVVWDGLDRSGRACASEVYFYRLTTKQGVVTKRMVLVK
jgi:hypothetical protein